MTSKELLLTLQIYNDRFIQKGEKFIDTKQMYETIGKDLEVLEILKDRLYFDYQFNVEDRVYHKIVMKFISFTDDDYEKVKEWLEGGKQKVASSTDRNQEIYITEERREELFKQLLENELSKSRDEYHYEKEYLLSAEYLERICLGKTGLSDSHYTKLIEMLSKEYEEWKEK